MPKVRAVSSILQLKLHDVVVTNCRSADAGGGIFAARLQADHCVVTGNTLSKNAAFGAGIVATRSLAMDYCSVTKNNALADNLTFAGGIRVERGQFFIAHSTIASNAAAKTQERTSRTPTA